MVIYCVEHIINKIKKIKININIKIKISFNPLEGVEYSFSDTFEL